FFYYLFLLLIPLPPRSTLFPYTTLFRSLTWLEYSIELTLGSLGFSNFLTFGSLVFFLFLATLLLFGSTIFNCAFSTRFMFDVYKMNANKVTIKEPINILCFIKTQIGRATC